MKQNYIWVPWFIELARKISKNGESYLIEKSKEVNWIKKNPALLAYGDENIDPFSFFYFLASKNSRHQQKPVFSSVHEVFEMEEQRPSVCTIPTPAFNLLFHDGNNFRPDLLWSFFREAVDDEKSIDQQTSGMFWGYLGLASAN